MASFNFSTRQMSAKIVYYGPGLCGKTTSLKYVFHHTRAEARGKMVSLATETDRTLFFDLLPLEVGTVAGFHTRIQLYTVPGQVFYNSTRRLVLKGVDGIVFVADSQPAMLPSNVESFRNLEVNLAELGIEINDIPLVLQYNKRDLPEGCSVAELSQALNSNGWPEFETSAIEGSGIFEVLREISKLTLISLKKQLEDGVPETLIPPIAPSPAQTVDEPASARREVEAPVTAVAQPREAAVKAETEPSMSDDEIEDQALDQLDSEGGSQLVDAVPEPAASEVGAEELAAKREIEEPKASVEAEAAPAEPAKPEDDIEAAAEEPTEKPEESLEAEATAAEPAEPEDSVEAETTTEEPVEEPAADDIAALAETNGRRRLDHALNLALSGPDLERAHRVLLDLQVRDERDRVLYQVRDIEWSLQDIDSLQDVLLNLKIELEREDA